ncbi:hypothetical protein MNBD_ALPHA02-66 [hydrothermal vent metagenome]|uniref:Uncharacterized protein n=1 Tax=hydrothermal vent metagenome TaxID=652676 RepID=A0A3B0RSM7_9ZZZZ
MSKGSFLQSGQIISRFFILLLVAGITTSFTLLPVRAYAEDYYRSNSINAGVFLRIPFGPTKKNDDKVKYGLRLNMNREFNYRPQWNSDFRLDRRQTFNADIISLNFSEDGFKNIAFAGRQTFIYKNGMLYAADAENGEGGTSTFVWVLATVGVLSLATVAALAISFGKCGDGFGQDPCKN